MQVLRPWYYRGTSQALTETIWIDVWSFWGFLEVRTVDKMMKFKAKNCKNSYLKLQENIHSFKMTVSNKMTF